MNVFWLDEDYYTASRYMTDEHVGSKMIIEAAQIIGEALQMRGFDQPWLRSGYESHPLTQWAAESSENAHEVAKMASAMYHEKQYRYGGGHKSFEEGILPLDFNEINYGGDYTEPPHCVGNGQFGGAYDHDDLVTAYRDYYANEKAPGGSWTARPVPEWVTDYNPDFEP